MRHGGAMCSPSSVSCAPLPNRASSGPARRPLGEGLHVAPRVKSHASSARRDAGLRFGPEQEEASLRGGQQEQATESWRLRYATKPAPAPAKPKPKPAPHPSKPCSTRPAQGWPLTREPARDNPARRRHTPPPVCVEGARPGRLALPGCGLGECGTMLDTRLEQNAARGTAWQNAPGVLHAPNA